MSGFKLPAGPAAPAFAVPFGQPPATSGFMMPGKAPATGSPFGQPPAPAVSGFAIPGKAPATGSVPFGQPPAPAVSGFAIPKSSMFGPAPGAAQPPFAGSSSFTMKSAVPPMGFPSMMGQQPQQQQRPPGCYSKPIDKPQYSVSNFKEIYRDSKRPATIVDLNKLQAGWGFGNFLYSFESSKNEKGELIFTGWLEPVKKESEENKFKDFHTVFRPSTEDPKNANLLSMFTTWSKTAIDAALPGIKAEADRTATAMASVTAPTAGQPPLQPQLHPKCYFQDYLGKRLKEAFQQMHSTTKEADSYVIELNNCLSQENRYSFNFSVRINEKGPFKTAAQLSEMLDLIYMNPQYQAAKKVLTDEIKCDTTFDPQTQKLTKGYFSGSLVFKYASASKPEGFTKSEWAEAKKKREGKNGIPIPLHSFEELNGSVKQLTAVAARNEEFYKVAMDLINGINSERDRLQSKHAKIKEMEEKNAALLIKISRKLLAHRMGQGQQEEICDRLRNMNGEIGSTSKFQGQLSEIEARLDTQDDSMEPQGQTYGARRPISNPAVAILYDRLKKQQEAIKNLVRLADEGKMALKNMRDGYKAAEN